ncbi:hypothetical protein SFRURICE_003125 [Spodoptera frugiperda]|nr:hypothetical protein SFRURICE_003125 [Spodoptera frugiperda]
MTRTPAPPNSTMLQGIERSNARATANETFEHTLDNQRLATAPCRKLIYLSGAFRHLTSQELQHTEDKFPKCSELFCHLGDGVLAGAGCLDLSLECFHLLRDQVLQGRELLLQGFLCRTDFSYFRHIS